MLALGAVLGLFGGLQWIQKRRNERVRFKH